PAVALHVTDDTTSLTGPVIGLHRPGSVWVWTADGPPGHGQDVHGQQGQRGGEVQLELDGVGVVALVGTRKESSPSLDPAAALPGCTVTCAHAGAPAPIPDVAVTMPATTSLRRRTSPPVPAGATRGAGAGAQ
ncbi:MAG TPA: hypothetical protein VLZ77_03405, partial [Acidimicrobiales bacterium]|nr:hypothetical protein [Acidimicrobiales bacterium]